jgi:hypothetical protein
MGLLDYLKRLQGSAGETSSSMKQMGTGSAEGIKQMNDGLKEAEKSQDQLKAASERAAASQQAFNSSILPAVTSVVSFSTSLNSYQNSLRSVENAQAAHNRAVQQFGEDSRQAETTLNSLQNAENSSANARNAMAMSFINTASSLSVLAKNFKSLETTQAGVTSGMGKMATGAGAVAFFMMAVSTGSDQMRIAFSVLTGVMVALTMAQIAYQAVLAGTLTMTGAGAIAVAAGIAAMGATYAAAKAMQADATKSQGETTAALNSKMSDYEPGDIIVNNYITADKIDWEAAPAILEQISRTLQDNIERRCKTLGASL